MTEPLTCESCGGVLTYATKQVHDLEKRMDEILRELFSIRTERDRLRAALGAIAILSPSALKKHAEAIRRQVHEALAIVGMSDIASYAYTTAKVDLERIAAAWGEGAR